MSKRVLQFSGVFLVSGVLALLAIQLLSAQTESWKIDWWVMGSGGGPSASDSFSLQATLGQPIVGSEAASESYRLCSGYWCGAGGQTSLFLPLVVNDFCDGFNGPHEVEPNNSFATANGPLCFYRTYTGNPDSDVSDYFYFTTRNRATIRVVVTNFDPVGQVLLYYHEADDLLVAQDTDRVNGQYTITYTGDPGRYYVRLVSFTNPVGSQTYNLTLSLP